jgi:hypothetical protein
MGSIVFAVEPANHFEEIHESGGNPKKKENRLKRRLRTDPLVEKIADPVANPDARREHDSDGKQIAQVFVLWTSHLL